jgi:aminomethyltransferase
MQQVYGDVSAEYHVIRHESGLVDYAGAGVLRVSGAGATAFLSRICSRSVDFLLEGQILPALLISDEGYLSAEVLVHCEGSGFLIEVWPDRAVAARERLISAAAELPDVTVTDLSAGTRVLALEGPASPAIAQTLLSLRVSSMAYPSFVSEQWNGIPILVSRTGVSGEYGFKFHIAAEHGDQLAEALREKGAVPVGREALDICRLEMRFANLERESAGNPVTPFTVGLQWMVDFRHDFLGRDALLSLRQQDVTESPVCFQAEADTEIPVPGTPLLASGTEIGRVRHAMYSPGLRKVIGIADLESDLAVSGLDLALGGPQIPVRTVSSPFLVATSLGVRLE